MVEYDKTRTSLTLPTPLYNLMHADSIKYGIPKSTIVATLLLNYYRENHCIEDVTTEVPQASK